MIEMIITQMTYFAIRRNIDDGFHVNISDISLDDGKFKKFKLFLIYIFLGFLILAFILGFKIMPYIRKKYLIFFYFFFLLFGLIYYIIIFGINILMLTIFIGYNGINGFINNCDRALDKVEDLF